jgi:hypothetical protein
VEKFREREQFCRKKASSGCNQKTLIREWKVRLGKAESVLDATQKFLFFKAQKGYPVGKESEKTFYN